MAKQFEFADFIDEFKVSFNALDDSGGVYNNEGKWIPGGETTTPTEGIVLPLNNDDIKFAPNGIYDSQARKIYTLSPLKIGQYIEVDGVRMVIYATRDYSAYADVYIYYAKGDVA